MTGEEASLPPPLPAGPESRMNKTLLGLVCSSADFQMEQPISLPGNSPSVCLSIDPSILPSTHPSVHPPIHPSILPSTHLITHSSSLLPINLSIYPPSRPSFHLSLHPPTRRYSSIVPNTHLSASDIPPQICHLGIAIPDLKVRKLSTTEITQGETAPERQSSLC